MSEKQPDPKFPTGDGAADPALPDFAEKMLTNHGALPDFMAELAFGPQLRAGLEQTGETTEQ